MNFDFLSAHPGSVVIQKIEVTIQEFVQYPDGIPGSARLSGYVYRRYVLSTKLY